MKKLFYQLLFAYFYLLSLLPFWVLHRVSEFLFFLVYYVAGYRKKMVKENMRLAFPEKSEVELNTTLRAFYLHFCDLIIESVKSVGMTQKDFNKRYFLKDWPLLQERFKQGQSPLLVSPHAGNWEWVFSLVEYIPITTYAIYQPLKNKHLDQYVRDTRQRYGAKMVSMKETFKTLLRAHEEGEQSLTWFAADQACSPEKAYWTRFLNRDAAFHAGYEGIARQTGQPILFLDIKRKGRSMYELSLTTICENANELAEGEAVEKFARLTEQRIRDTPAYWLWTHNRWKYKRPASDNIPQKAASTEQ